MLKKLQNEKRRIEKQMQGMSNAEKKQHIKRMLNRNPAIRTWKKAIGMQLVVGCILFVVIILIISLK